MTRTQRTWITICIVATLLVVALYIYWWLVPGRGIPKDSLIGMEVTQCKQEVNIALNARDIKGAELAVQRLSNAVATFREDGNSDPTHLEYAGRILRELSHQVRRESDIIAFEAIQTQVQVLLSNEKYDQASEIIAISLLDPSSPEMEKDLEALQLQVVKAQRPKYQSRLEQIRRLVDSENVVAAFRVIEDLRSEGAPPDIVAEAQSSIPPDVISLPSVGFIEISGGTYTVGTPENEFGRESPEFKPSKIKVSTFSISTIEITQQAYRMIFPERKWQYYKGDMYPAHSITYSEAVSFCEKLSSLDPNFEYSIPTEFEWEIACRGCLHPDDGPVAAKDKSDRKKFTESKERAATELRKYAFFLANSSGPSKVKQKRPNCLDLYDMHGNVSEWCRRDDSKPHWYKNILQGQPIRGGSITSIYQLCRAGARAFEKPGNRKSSIGFRIIRRREAGHR